MYHYDYDVMQVCVNGHVITDYYNAMPEDREEFCDVCGQKTMVACPKCKSPIRGGLLTMGMPLEGEPAPIPDHCPACGAAYPWKEAEEKAEQQGTTRLTDALAVVERICSRFHLVAQELKKRRDARTPLTISDEYDVQDLLRALLSLHFDDIRSEEWTPSYAGRSSRMDFLLKEEKIVIEVKKTRTELREKELGDQIIVDIEHYRKHPDCQVLVCFVYDPEHLIRNPKGFETDLSKGAGKVKVRILIAPKGY